MLNTIQLKNYSGRQCVRTVIASVRDMSVHFFPVAGYRYICEGASLTHCSQSAFFFG